MGKTRQQRREELEAELLKIEQEEQKERDEAVERRQRKVMENIDVLIELHNGIHRCTRCQPDRPIIGARCYCDLCALLLIKECKENGNYYPTELTSLSINISFSLHKDEDF